jgi:hypothetical protein
MGTGAHRKGYPPQLVESFASNLSRTGSIVAAAQAVHISEDTARGIVRKNPALRLLKAPVGKLQKTHGDWDSPEWRAWHSMRSRCTPGNKDYHRYGGRGIRVCERLATSHEYFLADMGRKPTPVHSLDRIDVNGNYEPTNCRWATAKEQAQNRRTSIMLTIDGVTRPLGAWAHERGLGADRVWQRLARGWSHQEALRPLRRYQNGAVV